MNTVASSTSVRSIDTLTTPAHPVAKAAFTGNVQSIRMLLRVTFSLVPIVAGLDKFTNILTNWEAYLNPIVARLLPFSPHLFMEVVGIIEIVAGTIVFLRPRIGAYIVTAWLASIALSLLASGHYLDVAVRDLVMAIAAFSLASLTPRIESSRRNQQSLS